MTFPTFPEAEIVGPHHPYVPVDDAPPWVQTPWRETGADLAAVVSLVVASLAWASFAAPRPWFLTVTFALAVVSFCFGHWADPAEVWRKPRHERVLHWRSAIRALVALLLRASVSVLMGLVLATYAYAVVRRLLPDLSF